MYRGCLSWRKDKNFKANHNSDGENAISTNDVCLGAKIRILKQITTNVPCSFDIETMFVLAQR